MVMRFEIKTITLRTQESKSYLSASIVYICDVIEGDKGRVFTRIVLSNGDELKVRQSKDEVLGMLFDNSNENMYLDPPEDNETRKFLWGW